MAKAETVQSPPARRPALLSIELPPLRHNDNGESGVSTLVQKLPSADETREAVSAAAQRAVGTVREALSSARGQLSEVSLPDSLQNVPLPGRKPRRRRQPRWWLMIALVVVAVGAFLTYRWMSGSDEDEDLYAEDWPAEPSNTPGAGGEPREDDRAAELDAEQSLDVRQQTGAPAGVNEP